MIFSELKGVITLNEQPKVIIIKSIKIILALYLDLLHFMANVDYIHAE